ncbi:MAG TPA: hypothetical protein VEK79_25075 [Thermoanaerobaculia bacterium]|nr:hypothetical protein [Thermoanaerobaculia bacterium]
MTAAESRVIRSESPADGSDTTARRYSIYSPELQLFAATYDDGTNVWTLPRNASNVYPRKFGRACRW